MVDYPDVTALPTLDSHCIEKHALTNTMSS